jgi:hypothetical protein
MLEISRAYPTGLETRECIEDPRVTRTGFRPDPYTGTVFAGPGTGAPEGTRVHPSRTIGFREDNIEGAKEEKMKVWMKPAGFWEKTAPFFIQKEWDVPVVHPTCR